MWLFEGFYSTILNNKPLNNIYDQTVFIAPVHFVFISSYWPDGPRSLLFHGLWRDDDLSSSQNASRQWEHLNKLPPYEP